jgi:hypothetical protein
MNNDSKHLISVRVLDSEKSELKELARKHDLSLDRVTRWAIREGLAIIRRTHPLPSAFREKATASGVELVIQ